MIRPASCKRRRCPGAKRASA